MRFFVSGDSFVVNACLARKGIDDWLLKQKYYCTSAPLERRDCHREDSCGSAARVSTRVRVHVFYMYKCSVIDARSNCVCSRCLCVFHLIGTRCLRCPPPPPLLTLCFKAFHLIGNMSKLSKSFVGGRTFNICGEIFMLAAKIELFLVSCCENICRWVMHFLLCVF